MTKPFKLDNLKKVSRHEVDLIRGLYELLPATDVRDKLHVSIRKVLMKHLGQDIRYYLASVEKKKYNEFSATLPQTPALMIMGLTPIDRKVIIHIDHHIANLAVNKLLGGGGTGAEDVKPFTETEQGVLQYLVMQILSQIHLLAGAEPRVHFRFEKFVFDPRQIAQYASDKDSVCILTIEVSIFGQSGFIRLAFPYPFLEAVFNLPMRSISSTKERKYFSRQLAKWGFIKTSVWAEAGNSLLSPVEIKDLEAGDVVLFDETGLKLSGKKIAGDVLIHFGATEGGVRSEVADVEQKLIRYRLKDKNI